MSCELCAIPRRFGRVVWCKCIKENMPLKCKKCHQTHTANAGCEWERWVRMFRDSEKCIVPHDEANHKVACREPATMLTMDGFPSCADHALFYAKKEWKGYIAGA